MKMFLMSLTLLLSFNLSAKEMAQKGDILGKTFVNKDASCHAIVDIKENWLVDCKQLSHAHRGITKFTGTGVQLQTLDYGLSDLYQALTFTSSVKPAIQAYVVKDNDGKISLALVYGSIADGDAEVLLEK